MATKADPGRSTQRRGISCAGCTEGSYAGLEPPPTPPPTRTTADYYRYHLFALYALSAVQCCCLAALCYAHTLDPGSRHAAGLGSRQAAGLGPRYTADVGQMVGRVYTPADAVETATTPATATTSTTTPATATPPPPRSASTSGSSGIDDVSGIDDPSGQADQPRLRPIYASEYAGAKSRGRRSSLDDGLTTPTTGQPATGNAGRTKEEFVWLSSYSRITVSLAREVQRGEKMCVCGERREVMRGERRIGH